MSNFYRIDGVWIDDGSCFSGYLICALDGLPEDCEHAEEDVFFYGLPRSQAEDSIGESEGEFKITAVYNEE